MGAIWLGMTKIAHALMPEDLGVNERIPQLDYGIPRATGWDNFSRGLWIPFIFLAALIVGTMAYCKKGKNPKAKKVLKIVTAILVILFVIWVILKVLAILI